MNGVDKVIALLCEAEAAMDSAADDASSIPLKDQLTSFSCDIHWLVEDITKALGKGVTA